MLTRCWNDLSDLAQRVTVVDHIWPHFVVINQSSVSYYLDVFSIQKVGSCDYIHDWLRVISLCLSVSHRQNREPSSINLDSTAQVDRDMTSYGCCVNVKRGCLGFQLVRLVPSSQTHQFMHLLRLNMWHFEFFHLCRVSTVLYRAEWVTI